MREKSICRLALELVSRIRGIGRRRSKQDIIAKASHFIRWIELCKFAHDVRIAWRTPPRGEPKPSRLHLIAQVQIRDEPNSGHSGMTSGLFFGNFAIVASLTFKC